MVLQNYWGFLACIQTKIWTNEPSGNVGKDVGGVSVGVMLTGSSGYVGNIQSNGRILNDGMSLRLGTGTGTVSPTDYALFNDVSDSISQQSLIVTANGTSDGCEFIYQYLGTNLTENDITVTEVGLAKTYRSAQYTESTILFAKVILDEPITVPAGRSVSLTFMFKEQ